MLNQLLKLLPEKQQTRCWFCGFCCPLVAKVDFAKGQRDEIPMEGGIVYLKNLAEYLQRRNWLLSWDLKSKLVLENLLPTVTMYGLSCSQLQSAAQDKVRLKQIFWATTCNC